MYDRIVGMDIKDEKLLPEGEPGIEVTALPVLRSKAPAQGAPQIPPHPEMRIHRKPVEQVSQPFAHLSIPAYVSQAKPMAYTPPVQPASQYVPPNLPGVPSPKQQQWGVVISIVIIVLMIIIGAFYAWGQRIAQNQIPTATSQY